jgi:hypothetical protein
VVSKSIPALLSRLLSIPHIYLIYSGLRSEPPRTRTWNLEIKSLRRRVSGRCSRLQISCKSHIYSLVQQEATLGYGAGLVSKVCQERCGRGCATDVHCGNPTPINFYNLRKRNFVLLLKRAGLPEIRFHDLRHTCATLLLGRGVHPKYVQHLLGHKSIKLTLDRYSHWIPSMGRATADGMDEALG